MYALRIGIAFLVAASLSACAAVNTKLMHNPQTGDVKECKRDPWKNWEWEEKAVLKACVEEYKKLGYVEAGASANAASTPTPTTLESKLA